ncbi:ion transporter [Undibacterium parvum]|uniref:Ion transporter n=1 Tax=Undibacterium parvum TaxID=401471 RepID=A0A3Q9BMY4_9BURK|nr:ion transporter [Undibacterium parvum]AZP10685.1 ion transporter [Undibacterium parvum]
MNPAHTHQDQPQTRARPQSSDLGTEQLLDKPLAGWRLSLYTIIFEADTRAGRYFDIGLIIAILVSVLVVMLDSMASFNASHGTLLTWVEYGLTAIFTLEYLARLVCVRRPWRYARSFFGIVDLLTVLPSYLTLFFPELYVLVDVRVLRLLRVFRVFKMTAYLEEFSSLGRALRASSRKILVFLCVVLMVVLIMGTVMYLVEGPEHGYTSIPISVYWAITTMTTVGFGDITPKTDLGRLIASMMMLLGWGVLAVPTGIVTAEMGAQRRETKPVQPTTRSCHECLTEGHVSEALYCLHCGASLPPYQREANESS